MLRSLSCVLVMTVLGAGVARAQTPTVGDTARTEVAPRPAPDPNQPRPASPEDLERFMVAARIAWTYVDRQYQPETGLINSVIGYPYATVWDMGSGLAALFCAHELGFLPTQEYDQRMGRALRTLQSLKLFEGIAFNKNYSTRTGAIAGQNDRSKASERGYGWSATDIARLLVWLKIIAVHHPQHAAAAEGVANRLQFSQLVQDGYLWGGSLTRSRKLRRYIEGRIPYEQYAAAGFALWDQPAERALRLQENAIPISVMEVPLVADRRGYDHLTSEPLTLLGLELGWTPEMAELAAGLLRVQEERHRRTGQVTMISEDAIPRAPHFFYYYTANFHGEQFAVVTQTHTVLPDPRWVSAKAAFAWHALQPSDYTRLAMETVQPAGHQERGWSSGVYERTGQPTGSENINTAAVILEATLYHQRGRPLIQRPGSDARSAGVHLPPES